MLSFGTNALSVLLNTGSPDLSQRFQYAPGFWQLPGQSPHTPYRHRDSDLNGDGLDDLLLSYEVRTRTGK